MRIIYAGSCDYLKRNTPYLVVDEVKDALSVLTSDSVIENIPHKGLGFVVDEPAQKCKTYEYLRRVETRDTTVDPKDYATCKMSAAELTSGYVFCAIPVLDTFGKAIPSDSHVMTWEGEVVEVDGYLLVKHSLPLMNLTPILMCAWNLWHIGTMYAGFENEREADCNISTEGLQRVQARYKGNTVLEQGRVHDAFILDSRMLLVYGTDGRIKRIRQDCFDLSTTLDSEISDEDYAKRILAGVPSAVSSKYQGSDISRALRVAYELLGL